MLHSADVEDARCCRKTVKTLLAVLLLLFLSACAVRETGREVELQFRSTPMSREELRAVPMWASETGDEYDFGRRWHEEFPITVRTDRGSVRVRGPFLLPCEGGVLEGEAGQVHDLIQLTVTWPVPDTCSISAAGQWYEALITGVPRGTYWLVLQHFNDVARPDGVVFKQQGVEVP